MVSAHRVLSAGVLAIAAAACATTVTIGRIATDPQRFANREIRLRGEVVESESDQGSGAYRVTDGTGDLWVLSTAAVPPAGVTVEVTGTVRDGFDLRSLGSNAPPGDARGMVLSESSHRIIPR